MLKTTNCSVSHKQWHDLSTSSISANQLLLSVQSVAKAAVDAATNPSIPPGVMVSTAARKKYKKK